MSYKIPYRRDRTILESLEKDEISIYSKTNPDRFLYYDGGRFTVIDYKKYSETGSGILLYNGREESKAIGILNEKVEEPSELFMKYFVGSENIDK